MDSIEKALYCTLDRDTELSFLLIEEAPHDAETVVSSPASSSSKFFRKPIQANLSAS